MIERDLSMLVSLRKNCSALCTKTRLLAARDFGNPHKKDCTAAAAASGGHYHETG